MPILNYSRDIWVLTADLINVIGTRGIENTAKPRRAALCGRPYDTRLAQ